MSSPISSRDFELLSAYLDGQLPDAARQRLEARLGRETALRQEYEDLRHMHIVLRSLPLTRAPRNFTLTPQMAGQPARQRTGPRLYPLMGFASALASLLFVLVLLGDLLGVLPGASPGGGSVAVQESLDFSTQVAMQPAVQEKAAATTEMPVEAFSTMAEASPTTEDLMLEMRLAPTETASDVMLAVGPTEIVQAAPEIPSPEATAQLELSMPADSNPPLATDTPLPMGGGNLPDDNGAAAKQVVQETPTPTLTFTPTPVPTETPIPSPTNSLPTMVEPAAEDALLFPSPTPEILAFAPTAPEPAVSGESETGDLFQAAPAEQYDFLPEPAPTPSSSPARLLWWGVQLLLLAGAVITGIIALILRLRER